MEPRVGVVRATVLKRFAYSKDPLSIDYEVPDAFRHGQARVISVTFPDSLTTINPNNEYLYLKYYRPSEPCRCIVIDLDYGDYTGERLARRITDILRSETPARVNVTYSPDGRLIFKCMEPGCRVRVPRHPGDDPKRFVEEGDVLDDRWMRNLSTSSVNDMIYHARQEEAKGSSGPTAEVTTRQINLDYHHVVFLHSSALGTSLGPVGEWIDCIPTVRQNTEDGKMARLCCCSSEFFLPIPRDGKLDFRLLDGQARGVAVGSWALLELELVPPRRLTALREAARSWARALPERLARLLRSSLSTAATLLCVPRE
jgi:hypothetical protein